MQLWSPAGFPSVETFSAVEAIPSAAAITAAFVASAITSWGGSTLISLSDATAAMPDAIAALSDNTLSAASALKANPSPSPSGFGFSSLPIASGATATAAALGAAWAGAAAVEVEGAPLLLVKRPERASWAFLHAAADSGRVYSMNP